MEVNSSGFTKPAITRVARRAGVKSMSDDSVDTVRNLIALKVNELVKVMNVVNEENNTKTVMTSDFYNASKHLGYNVAKLDD